MTGALASWRRLGSEHRFLLVLVGTATFFEGYDRSIVALALRQIRDTFELTQSEASVWLTFLYLGALPALAVSRWADRAGRRRILLLSVMGYTVATAATAFAPSMGVFVAWQFLARLFGTVEAAIAWTMVAEEFPSDSRGFGFGVLGMSAALGIGTAAVLFGGILDPLGVSWRAMYLIGLPPLAIIAVLRRRLPETRRFVIARDSGSLAKGWMEILRPRYRRVLLLVLGTAFLVQLTSQAEAFAIDFLQTDRGLSVTASNLMLVGAGLPAIPIMVSAGSLSDRYGRRLVACGFGALGLVGAMGLFWAPGGVPVLLPFLTLTLVGQLGSWPVLAGYAMELFPTSLRSQSAAWASVARVGGTVSSFGLGGVLIAATGGLPGSVTIMALGPLAAILIVALLFPDTHGRELEETSGDTASGVSAVGP